MKAKQFYNKNRNIIGITLTGIICSGFLIYAPPVQAGDDEVVFSPQPTKIAETTDEIKEYLSPVVHSTVDINSEFSMMMEKYDNKSVDDDTLILEKDVNRYNEYNNKIARQNEKIAKELEEKNKILYQIKVKPVLDGYKKYLGVPYVWGGDHATKGMDCSSFVKRVYGDLGYKLPRVSKDQSKVGELVPRNKLRPGDLLFFDTFSHRDSKDIRTPTEEMEAANLVYNGYKPNKVSHVGIYIGEGKMVHASSVKVK